jgi:hypothetical protein
MLPFAIKSKAAAEITALEGFVDIADILPVE